MRFGLSLVAALLLSPAPAAPRLPPARGVADLIGVWQGVEADAPGYKGPFTTVWDIREGVIVRITRPGGRAGEWTYTVDPTASPKRIDLFPAADERRPGVYAVQGDKLKVCYVAGTAADDRPRPTSVEAGGPDLVVLTFRRERP